jgi:hypothetical protein
MYSAIIHTGKGEGDWGRVKPCIERERGNSGEYRSQSWVENTNMTACTQEIGILWSI